MLTNEHKKRVKLWLDALRSGEYKQGQQYLAQFLKKRADWHYCCLGVACEIASKYIHLDTSIYDNGSCAIPGDVKKYNDNCSFLDQDIKNWYGLSDWAENELLRMNDSFGWNFERIANWIEENILGEKGHC